MPVREGDASEVDMALRSAWAVGAALLAGLSGCGRTNGPAGLGPTEVEALVRPGTTDASRWGSAVHDALQAIEIPVTRESACQVLAVIEQESGYAADPEVPGLGEMALEELEIDAEEKLGWLGDDALSWLIDTGPPGEPTFAERLAEVRTEGELDWVYRDLVAFHGERARPVQVVVDILAPRLDERHNPVRTVGSMQVSVDWAEQHRPKGRNGVEREDVRDALYTVDGGVRYGTARLFAGADYEDAGLDGLDAATMRFADFNAGVFASRNAAFQGWVAELADVELALDGDLLAWTPRGRPVWSPDGATAAALLSLVEDGTVDLDERQIRRDLKREKTLVFARTRTYEAVYTAFEARSGAIAPADTARIPGIALDSPKLSGRWTTGSFAERTTRRYRDCLER